MVNPELDRKVMKKAWDVAIQLDVAVIVFSIGEFLFYTDYLGDYNNFANPKALIFPSGQIDFIDPAFKKLVRRKK